MSSPHPQLEFNLNAIHFRPTRVLKRRDGPVWLSVTCPSHSDLKSGCLIDHQPIFLSNAIFFTNHQLDLRSEYPNLILSSSYVEFRGDANTCGLNSFRSWWVSWTKVAEWAWRRWVYTDVLPSIDDVCLEPAKNLPMLCSRTWNFFAPNLQHESLLCFRIAVPSQHERTSSRIVFCYDQELHEKILPLSSVQTESNPSRNFRMEGIIFAHVNTSSRMEFGSLLFHNNVSRKDCLSSKLLDSSIFWIWCSSILCRSSCFLGCSSHNQIKWRRWGCRGQWSWRCFDHLDDQSMIRNLTPVEIGCSLKIGRNCSRWKRREYRPKHPPKLFNMNSSWWWGRRDRPTIRLHR